MLLSKKLMAEFIGTFWLVLGGCGSAVLAAGFPELGITVEAKKGDVVVFHNTLTEIPASSHPKIHPKSLHAGLPVLKGEKWMVNLWFRENLRY